MAVLINSRYFLEIFKCCMASKRHAPGVKGRVAGAWNNGKSGAKLDLTSSPTPSCKYTRSTTFSVSQQPPSGNLLPIIPCAGG